MGKCWEKSRENCGKKSWENCGGNCGKIMGKSWRKPAINGEFVCEDQLDLMVFSATCDSWSQGTIGQLSDASSCWDGSKSAPRMSESQLGWWHSQDMFQTINQWWFRLVSFFMEIWDLGLPGPWGEPARLLPRHRNCNQSSLLAGRLRHPWSEASIWAGVVLP